MSWCGPAAARRAAALLGVIVFAGCGSGAEEGASGRVSAESTSADTTGTATSVGSGSSSNTGNAPSTEPIGPRTSTPEVAPAATADGVDVLGNCADVPSIATDVVGSMSPTSNPDPVFEGVLKTYAAEHRDRFGGLWIDREARGTIVLAFTDDPEPHRQALAARSPSPDDVNVIEPPPEIVDDRPIGEWGVAFDVVQVDYSEDELSRAASAVVPLLRDAGFDFSSAGADVMRNRVALSLTAPVTPEVSAAMARLIVDETTVDLEMVCVEGPTSDAVPEPIDPGTPLDVIVLPDAAGAYPPDTPVECNGVRFRLGALAELTPIEQVDPDLRAVLDSWLAAPEDPFLVPPRDGWALLYEDGETALFINVVADGVWGVAADLGGHGWFGAGAGRRPLCNVNRVLPQGLGRVEWQLDPSFPAPAPDTTELHVLAMEQACTSGSELGERLLGPQVVETDDAVRIAFAAIPLTGEQLCPSNPPTPVTITLAAPLGDRQLRDGLLIAPITELGAD